MQTKIVTKINALPKLDKKINVAAYARVSSGKDAMLHSLSNQISYYNEKINNHEGWMFAGVYADEAVTGTRGNREEFQRMLEDCRKGKIDLILTKSISRFARNTFTLLEVVRELKTMNVDVYFEEQNIHSISNEGEMVLTFLASFAQEESRSFSENMKWRIKRDFEEGIIWGGQNKFCLGYRLINRKFVVVPDEARLVRRIFDLYLDGYGFEMISQILTKEGIPTVRGKKAWNKSTIQNIIGNYNYTGDLLLQKTYIENHLTKKKRKNHGERNKFLVEDNHEPIITKEMFMKVTEIRKTNTLKYKIRNISHIKYPLSSHIRCSKCGKYYTHRTTKYNTLWACPTFVSKGKTYCPSQSIPEEILNDLICSSFNIAAITEDWVKSHLDLIEVFDKNHIKIYSRDGTIKECNWEQRSRSKSWTPQMKEQARLRALKQHGKVEE